MKTRNVEFTEDWWCPAHGGMVEKRVRRNTDKNGNSKFGGVYYACPNYSECGYYVTLDGKCKVLDG